MGTICILLGLIILVGSAFLGVYLTRAYLSSSLVSMLTTLPQGTTAYIVIIGICVFIGFLICLNLVMHGLTYNRVKKLEQNTRKLKF